MNMLLTLHYDHHSFTPSLSQFSTVMGPPDSLASDSLHDTARTTTSADDHSQQHDQDADPLGNIRTHLLPPSATTTATANAEPPDNLGAQASTIAPSAQGSSSTQSFPRASSGSDEESHPDVHIPRAPNAFILFRSHMIRTEAIPKTVEGKNSDLSKIIGSVWKGLSEGEKAHWEHEAKEAQKRHRLKYPNWRFAPGIQQGEDFSTKRSKPTRKRKMNQDDSDPQPSRKRAKRRPSPEEGKELERAGTQDGVILAPSSPVPYQFSLPLKSSQAAPLEFRTASTAKQTYKGKGKAQPRSPHHEELFLPRSERPSIQTDRIGGPSSQDTQANEVYVSPVHSPSTLQLPGADPSVSTPSSSPACGWDGHELESGSSGQYASQVESPEVSSSVGTHNAPVDSFDGFPVPLTLPPGSMASPSHDYSPEQSFSTLTSHRLFHPYYNLRRPQYSNAAVPLTQRYRRGAIDVPRSPLAQSLPYSDWIDPQPSGSRPPHTWSSLDQLLPPHEVWSDSSLPRHHDPSFRGAVTGGRPVHEEQSYSSEPGSSTAAGYVLPQYPSYGSSASGVSELAHALDYDDAQASTHKDSPPHAPS